jgi:uncharacterized protein YbaP (TraB family)
MLKSIGAAGLAAIAMTSAAPAPAQNAADDRAQVQDIVVTGRRSGVPMWTVRSDRTTLVLVGAIAGVSKTTRWDPEALTEALRKADRVMFPQSHALTVSNPFNLIGWLAKYKKMGSLPKGQTLSQFVAPEYMRRLAALRAGEMAQKDFERRHPLHLSNDLRDRAKGKVEYGRHAADYVEKAIKTHKLKLAVDPIAKSKAKPVVKDLFASQPAEHVPCLIDSIAAAEAGPAAVQARSDAWAARRVPEVLASPADKVFSSCWPAGAGIGLAPQELLAQMRELLDEEQVTLAVLGLRTLAETGGILDGLQAAGYDIQGPAWK